MTTLSITATHLARNFSDLLNQVRYQHVTLEVTRGNELIAYVSPTPMAAGYPITQLNRLLAGLPRLSAEESQQFLDDIHHGVAEQPMENDAWAS
jgi:antitoxin (DNA-binding transcriptional repressor) of toxin-antitoxin stability system